MGFYWLLSTVGLKLGNNESVPTNYHKIVLGVLGNVTSSLELYSRLVDATNVSDLPVMLTHSLSNEYEALLREAGLIDRGWVEGLQIFCANSEFAHPPLELFQRLIDHHPELFWSIANEYLSLGHILIAQSLEGMQDAETSLTKLMLRHCLHRVHLIDLPL